MGQKTEEVLELAWLKAERMLTAALAQIKELERRLKRAEEVSKQYRKVLLNVEQWDDLYPDLSAYDTLFELKDRASEVLE